MDKKHYIAPVVETQEIIGADTLLSVSSDEVSYGGSADEHNIMEADANERHDWDLW